MQIGGRRIGSIKKIELTDDNQAEITIAVEEPYAPLHEGTTAVIRGDLAVGRRQPLHRAHAGRRTATPSCPRARRHRRPTRRRRSSTSTSSSTRWTRRRARACRTSSRASATWYDGRGDAGQRRRRSTSPVAVGDAQGCVERAHRRPAGAQGASCVDTSQVVDGARPSAATTSPTSSRTRTRRSARSPTRTTALAEALDCLPQTLRRGNTTFVNLRATLDDLDVLVAASKPATKNLAPFLRELRPLVQRGAPDDRRPAQLRAPARRRQRPHRPAEQLAGARAGGVARPSRASIKALKQGARRCSRSSGPTRRTSSAGSATSARAPPTTTPTATSPASGRSSTPSRSRPARPNGALTPSRPPSACPACRQTRRPSRAARAAPRRPRPTARAPWRDASGTLDCDPSRRAPRPMKRVARHRRRARRGRRAGRLRHGRERRQRRLPRPRDLRQRRVRHPGRGRARSPASRSARSRRLDVTRRQEGRGRPAHRRPGFQDFRKRRDLHDPPAVADRRAVRRVRRRRSRSAGERQPAPLLARDPARARARASTCCRSTQHVAAGRPRPDQQHHAPALPRSGCHDHPQRARHRPGRARRATCSAALKNVRPGAAADRQGPRASSPSRTARSRRSRVDGDTVARPAGARAPRGSAASSTRRRRPPARRPSASAALEENFRLLPAVPARAARRRWSSLGDFVDRRSRPCVDATSAAPRPTSTRFVTGTLGPFADAGAAGARRRSARAPRPAGPALQKSLPLIQDLGDARPSRPSRSRRTSSLLLRSLQEHGRDRPLPRLVFYHAGATNGFDQYGHYVRTRLVLTTVHDVRDREPARAARRTSARTSAASRRRRRRAPARPSATAARRRSARRRPTPRRRRSPRAPRAARSSFPGRCSPGDGGSAPRRRAGRGARKAPRARRPTRSPPSPSSTTSSAMRRRSGGRLDRGEPGAHRRGTMLVVIVAVFLAYNANSGLPFVPDLRPQGRGAERRRPRQGQRRAHRRHARRHRRRASSRRRSRAARSSRSSA